MAPLKRGRNPTKPLSLLGCTPFNPPHHPPTGNRTGYEPIAPIIEACVAGPVFLPAKWLLQRDTPECRYHSQYRSQNRSRTSRSPSDFCLGLREYRQPDKHPRNQQPLHIHWSQSCEPLFSSLRSMSIATNSTRNCHPSGSVRHQSPTHCALRLHSSAEGMGGCSAQGAARKEGKSVTELRPFRSSSCRRELVVTLVYSFNFR